MMLVKASTTETPEQEQKRNAASFSSSFFSTVSTATHVANNLVPASQRGSATSEIDEWSAVIQHLSSHNDNQPAQFAPTPTLTPVQVRVKVTDSHEDSRELVECYLQTAARYGTKSEEASQAFRGIAGKYQPYIIKRLLSSGKFNLQKEDAEDIAQEALIKLWNWLNGYILTGQSDEDENQKKELGNFAQIVRIIIRNCLVNWLQHQYRAKSRAKAKAKNQGSIEVTNSVKFVTLHHVYQPHVLTSRIRYFGRELELSSHSFFASSRGKNDLVDQLYDAGDCIEPLFEQQELMEELAVAIAEMGRTKPHYRLVLLAHVKGRSYQQIAVENDWTIEQVKKYLYRARRWLANYFASTAAAATATRNEGENENKYAKEKESRVASGSVPRAERERKKVNKSKVSSTSAEEWQLAAD
jgi:RNA polymerase sigma factor (sigma-70 family)